MDETEALPPGMTRRQLLDMAVAAGLLKTHPGMAPELIAFAVMVAREAADQIEKLRASIAAIHCHALMGTSHEGIAAECETVIPQLAELRPNTNRTGA